MAPRSKFRTARLPATVERASPMNPRKSLPSAAVCLFASLLFVTPLLAEEGQPAATPAPPEELVTLGASSSPQGGAILGDYAYFFASTNAEGRELWRTDGSEAGTTMIKDIRVGSVSSHPEYAVKPVAFNGAVYFTANDGSGTALWKTDGTDAGTVEVADLGGHAVLEFISTGDSLYVIVSVGDQSSHLMHSDGTTAGTALVRSFSTTISMLRSGGSGVYFLGPNEPSSSSYRTLWTSDGTDAGTVRLDEAREYHLFGNKAVYTKYADYYGDDIWITDGTTSTRLGSAYRGKTFAAEMGGKLYLGLGLELWVTDGTSAGTHLVYDFEPEYVLDPPNNGQSGIIAFLQATPDKLFLICGSANPWEASNGYGDLWVSDGLTAGTEKLIAVRGFYPQYSQPATYQGIVVGDNLFFTSTTTRYGAEMWRSDGTPAGTMLAADILPDYYTTYAGTIVGYGSSPVEYFTFGSDLYFSASDRIHGAELWKSDGTPAGHTLVKNINPEGEIAGRVTDASTNAPLTDVAVGVYAKDGAGVMRFIRSFRTDADGNYLIEGLPSLNYYLKTDNDGPYVNQVYRDRQCPACDVALGEPVYVSSPFRVTDIDFALTKGGRISGTVSEIGTGAPVKFMNVAVASAWGAYPAAIAYTDENGNYVTTGVPAGDWVVATVPGNGYSSVIYDGVSCAAGCGASSTGTPVPVSAGVTTSSVDFSIGKYGQVSGIVTDSVTGEPVSGASVRAYARDREIIVSYSSNAVATATTATDGSFTLTLPDGQHSLFVEASYHLNEAWDDVPCGGCGLHAGTAVSAVPGQTTAGYDFSLEPRGGRIRGTVLDSAGAVLPSAYVRVLLMSTSGATASYTFASSNGSFAFPPVLSSGTYYLKAVPNYNPSDYLDELWDGQNGTPCGPACVPTTGTPIVIDGTSVVDGIDFRLAKGGKIAGRVYGSDTGLDVNSRVEIVDSTGQEVYDSWSVATFETAPRLYPGSYYLVARPYGNVYSPSYYGGAYACPSCSALGGDPIVVVADQTVTADMPMSQTGVITGRVVNAAGQPLGGATVYARLSGQRDSIATVSTAYDGYYTLRVTGTVEVIAKAWGYAAEAHNGVECPNCFDLPAIQVTTASVETVNFTLAPAVKISGYLTQPALGSLAKWAQGSVELYDSRGNLVATDSIYGSSYGSSGSMPFSFWHQENLGAGKYYLHMRRSVGTGYGYLGTTHRNKRCDEFCLAQATPLTVASGGEGLVGDVPVHVQGSIYGEVKNAAGTKSLEGVKIVAYNRSTGQRLVATTDKYGWYDIQVPGGAYSIYTDSFPHVNQVHSSGQAVDCVEGTCGPTSGVAVPIGASSVTANFNLTERPRRPRADFNRNGASDILLRNTSTGAMSLWMMDGTTVTNQGKPFNTLANPDWHVQGIGDFNGDGYKDVFIRNASTGRTVMWEMQGETILNRDQFILVGNLNWSIEAFGDTDGDGIDEIIWRHMTQGDLSMWDVNGHTLQNSARFARMSDLNWELQVLDDFNGDGKADILWRNKVSGALAIWFLNGRTILNSGKPFATFADQNWQIVGSGDFNGDGRADLFWRNAGTGQNAIWEMDGQTVLSSGPMPGTPTGWQVEFIADYNGDWRDDVLWRNPANGDVAMWLLKGRTLLNAGKPFMRLDTAWQFQPRGHPHPDL